MEKKELFNYLYTSYLDARKHKRHTYSQMIFESNLWENLIDLCDDIFAWKYKISPSIYFIQMNPIQREVFAWNFRDRIVHHLVYNIISPYWEKQFIYDCYSCRKGKWTSKWIERISKFMRSCSENYQKDWRILKMDIQWYFMSIDKDILREKNKIVLDNRENTCFTWKNNNWLPRYLVTWKFPGFLKKVIFDIIYNDPTENGIFKWKKTDYIWLPETKSLFFTPKNCGLPIWNLTSQLFSNIYLNEFDHFIKDELKVKYYGRYVDDFIIIHQDKEYLKSLRPIIKEYLEKNLHLKLHPKKIYLQKISHGVQFLWAFIKPYRCYRSKRSIKNFWKKIVESNYKPSEWCLNSYLGLFLRYKQYRLVQKIIKNIKYDNIKKKSKIIEYYTKQK